MAFGSQFPWGDRAQDYIGLGRGSNVTQEDPDNAMRGVRTARIIQEQNRRNRLLEAMFEALQHGRVANNVEVPALETPVIRRSGSNYWMERVPDPPIHDELDKTLLR